MKLVFLLLLVTVILAPVRAQQTQSIYYTASTSADGKSNITLGPYAGTVGGTHTVTLGAFAGQSNSGIANIFVGYAAGLLTTSGSYNAFLGYYAGYTNSFGVHNSFMGPYAGYLNTTGRYNSFLGSSAGYSNTTGSFNSFVGSSAGNYNTTGDNNAFLGYYAGANNTSGGNNAFVGYAAGFQNTTATANVFVGAQAGYSNTTASNNVFIGYQAGYANTTGSGNVVVGPSSGTVITTGRNNLMLGTNTQPTSGAIQNSVAIGANARVAVNNAIVLGDPTNTSVAIGIGTDSPQFPLDVRGTINLRNNGRIKFAHLSNSLQNGTTDQFLTVNEAGETVLARHRLRIDHVNQWSDNVFESTYPLRSLPSVATYIAEYGHLPGIPSAEQVVKEGVDLVKLNATLLEKVEELTLYSIQLEKTNQHLLQKDNQQQREIDELKRLMKVVLQRK